MTVTFGTDGVRGLANAEVSPELALRLGRAIVAVLAEEGQLRPAVLIGRDPRWSGEMLEAALIAGVTSAGGDAITLGVIPTAAVAHLTATGDAGAGVMISASHNAMPDNGLKVFGGDGFKLTDDEEARLGELLASGVDRYPTGTAVGRSRRDASGVSRYVTAIVEEADTDLDGLHVVVDGANGAAAQVAPMVYRQLGAKVTVIGGVPSPQHINDGVGSTHPQVVCDAVVEHGAAVGVTHDGDADRVLAAAADGTEVDGDAILAIIAKDARAEGVLTGDAVVTTVMTNLGFHHAMRAEGIGVVTTKVGDRYVLEAMRRDGLVLGGEQSGHLIQLDRGTTGDGLRSAVRLLRAMRRADASLAELASVMERLPQVLVNVPNVAKDRLDDSDVVASAVAAVEAELGESGRVLVRKSGTEPLVRVMVEAPTGDAASAAAERIAAAVRQDLAI
jgi:phosphoglucosamine mutase